MTLKLGRKQKKLEPYKSYINGWLQPILLQGQIWSLGCLNGKNVKQCIYPKQMYCMKWNESRSYMNPYEYQRLRSFSDFGSRSLGLNAHQNFKYLLLRNHRANSSKILYRTSVTQKGLEPYKSYINDDPGLTLTYLMEGQNCSLRLLNGKNVKQCIHPKQLRFMKWNVLYEPHLMSKVKVIQSSWSKVTRIVCPSTF